MPERDEAYMRERVIRYFQDVKHETSSKYAKYLAKVEIVRDYGMVQVTRALVYEPLHTPEMESFDNFRSRTIEGRIHERSFTTPMGMFSTFIMMEKEDAMLPDVRVVSLKNEHGVKYQSVFLNPREDGVFFTMGVSLRMCSECNQRKMQFFKCSSCRNDDDYHVRYCSKACQREHWPIHKKSCLSRNPVSARPPYVPAVYHVLKD